MSEMPVRARSARAAAKPPSKVVSEDPRNGGVQSVDRALRIMEVLGEDEEGYRLTDLAARTGLSTSTVHRLLSALQVRRFVQFDQSDGMWHVGRGAFAIGSAFVRRRNFVGPALPILRRLRDQTRETANLGVADEGEIVFLTQVESREIMRAITRVGGRAPMVASSMGKAILSTYSDADVAAVVQRHGMRRLTGKSILRLSELREDLSRVRVRGYAVDDEEFLTGLRCVASVVYDDHGEALAAVSVSGLTARMPNDRVEALGEIVHHAALQLTEAVGGAQADAAIQRT